MLKSKYVLLFFAACSLVIVLSGLIIRIQADKKIEKSTQNDPNKVEVSINNKKILAEIVNTPEKTQKGLSGRDSLGENEGMLFAFPKKDILQPFWMKDMKIDLDFIWINDDKVSQINENVKHPAPSTPDSKLEIIYPKNPIDYVLEVNAGFVEKNGIKVGDSVEINF